MTPGILMQLCVSPRRGPKRPVKQGSLSVGLGIEGDVHGRPGFRQVSLLEQERIERFDACGGRIGPGDFGENLIVKGIPLARLGIGSTLRVGKSAELRVSQLGKPCSSPCAIQERMGDCIMPRWGVFCQVIHGGRAETGSTVRVHRWIQRDTVQSVVLIVSDRADRGDRRDRTGPAISRRLRESGWHVNRLAVVPDEPSRIEDFLRAWSEAGRTDVIFTAGGTGFAERDTTPEATRRVMEREAPGLSEAMRAEGAKHTSRSWLSRGVAGLRQRTVIVNLPGSPKGATESLAAVISPLRHGVELLKGEAPDDPHPGPQSRLQGQGQEPRR